MTDLFFSSDTKRLITRAGTLIAICEGWAEVHAAMKTVPDAKVIHTQ